MVRTREIRLIFAVVVAFLLVACGDDSSDETETPVTADAIFARASERFQTVDTLHFDLQTDGTVALGGSDALQLRSAEGDIKRPDSARAKANITFGGANLSITMISIGEDQYITNFVSGSWQEAPPGLGYNPAVLFDEEEGIAHVLSQIQNAELLGTETVNGTEAYHLRGTVARETVNPIAAGALTSDTITFEIWVGQEQYDILKIVLTDPGNQEGAAASTWTLVTSQHNEPVTIERPNV